MHPSTRFTSTYFCSEHDCNGAYWFDSYIPG